MKVAVVGSRNFKYLDLVKDYIDSLPDKTVVVTGGARGVDAAAEDAARKRGLEVVVVTPDYSSYGHIATKVRNSVIARMADKVTAFWDGLSGGTANTLAWAAVWGRPVEVFMKRRWRNTLHSTWGPTDARGVGSTKGG